MTSRSRVPIATAPLLAALIGAAACIDDPSYGAVATNTDAVVFADAFGAQVDFAAFKGSKLDALALDTQTAHSGKVAIKVRVPETTEPSGGFAGGAFVANDPRNLAGYDALVLWMKASTAATIDALGLGNDNTGTSRYVAQIRGVSVSTDWTRVIVPIPAPTRLTSERGLFFFAVSAAGATPKGAFDLWIDDVQFTTLGSATLGVPAATIAADAVAITPGQSARVGGATVSFAALSPSRTVTASNGYFDFVSSAPDVATVDEAGDVTARAVGLSTITASLEGRSALGALAVNVVANDPNVFALLSSKYPARPVEKWLADWSMPAGQVSVSSAPDGADPMRTYSNLQYAGIEFVQKANQLDLTKTNSLHLELKTSDASEVHVKVVDFGDDGVVNPPTDGTPHGDDSQGEIVLGPSSSPSIRTGEWNTLEVPLSAFQTSYGQSPGLAHRAHVAQVIVAGPSSGKPLIGSLSLKNVYFHP